MILDHIFPLGSMSTSWTSQDSFREWQEVFSLSHSDNLTMISAAGDEGLPKSLLLQAAITYSSEGCRVAYICPEAFQEMPIPVHGMPVPDASLMKLVQMLYFTKSSQLIEFLSCIHQHLPLPDLLIIEHFDFYADQCENDSAWHFTARLCALLKNSSGYMVSQSTKGSIVPKILVSVKGTSDTRLKICRQFFPHIWIIQKENGEDGHSYGMTEYSRGISSNRFGNSYSWSLTFTFRPRAIILQSISKNFIDVPISKDEHY